MNEYLAIYVEYSKFNIIVDDSAKFIRNVYFKATFVTLRAHAEFEIDEIDEWR